MQDGYELALPHNTPSFIFNPQSSERRPDDQPLDIPFDSQYIIDPIAENFLSSFLSFLDSDSVPPIDGGVPTLISPPDNSSSRKRASTETSELSMSVEATPRKRRCFTPQEKAATNETRKDGACLLCQQRRKRCTRRHRCCKACEAAPLNERILSHDSWRKQLTDSPLFRGGPTEEFQWTRRQWLHINSDDTAVWRPGRAVTIKVAQDGMSSSLKLAVKQYNPTDGDWDTYTWTVDGAPYRWRMPCYAVADVHHAQNSLERYVEDRTQEYIQKKISKHHYMTWCTFQMAATLSREGGSTLLRETLKLWVASRIIEDPWRIVNWNDLDGLKPSSQPGPYKGKVPVTPVMDFQIDNITINHLLTKLRKSVLKNLRSKIMNKRNMPYHLEIYLCIFILLHNIELAIDHDRKFAQRYDMSTPFSNYGLIHQLFSGANIMLTNFHHVNNGISKIFKQDWSKRDNKSLAQLNDEQAEYMAKLSAEVEAQRLILGKLQASNQFDAPMYWCSQLFYDSWTPVTPPLP